MITFPDISISVAHPECSLCRGATPAWLHPEGLGTLEDAAAHVWLRSMAAVSEPTQREGQSLRTAAATTRSHAPAPYRPAPVPQSGGARPHKGATRRR